MKEKNKLNNSRYQVNKLGSLSSKIEKKGGYYFKEYIIEESNISNNLLEILSNFNNDNDNSFTISRYASTSSIDFSVYDVNNGSLYKSARADVVANKWYHIVAVWTKDYDGLFLYLNNL